MLKNNIIRIIILAIISLIIFNTGIVYASPLDDIFSQGDSFLEEGKNAGVAIDENKLKATSDQIYNVLLGIGIVLAVIVGAILGIQFMFGSIEQKVKIKESIIPYVIGCVVIFGAFGIWGIAVKIGGSLIEEGGSWMIEEETNDEPEIEKEERCFTTGMKVDECPHCGGNTNDEPEIEKEERCFTTGMKVDECPHCGGNAK